MEDTGETLGCVLGCLMGGVEEGILSLSVHEINFAGVAACRALCVFVQSCASHTAVEDRGASCLESDPLRGGGSTACGVPLVIISESNLLSLPLPRLGECTTNNLPQTNQSIESNRIGQRGGCGAPDQLEPHQP